MFAAALVTLALVTLMYGRQYPRSVSSVFEDVVTFGRLSPLVGFLSDMGIVLWLATAILFLHSAHRRLQESVPLAPDERGFYLFAVGTLLYLGLDDRLMIHEWLMAHWGIPKACILAVYGLVILVGGWRYRRYCLSGRAMHWLGIAGVAFAVSVASQIHLFAPWLHGAVSAGAQRVFEESAKWLGICALFLYTFLLTTDPPCRRQL